MRGIPSQTNSINGVVQDLWTAYFTVLKLYPSCEKFKSNVQYFCHCLSILICLVGSIKIWESLVQFQLILYLLLLLGVSQKRKKREEGKKVGGKFRTWLSCSHSGRGNSGFPGFQTAGYKKEEGEICIYWTPKWSKNRWPQRSFTIAKLSKRKLKFRAWENENELIQLFAEVENGNRILFQDFGHNLISNF